MNINILFFGPLVDHVGASSLIMENILDIEMLKQKLEEDYPSIGELRFSISVNRKLVHDNLILQHNDEVACLPPFSGG